MAYRGDGMELATASNDGKVCFWNPLDGSLRRVIEPGRGRLWSVDYAPGHQVIATSGDDGVIDLWRVADGQRIAELAGHTDRISSVTFSPDGRLLASASYDGTTRLWKIDGDIPRHGLTLLGFPKGWAAVTTDGRYKADGEVHGQFWHVVGMTRFEPDELDAYLDQPHRESIDQRLL
jgi:WD40 repeat protein